MRLCVIDARLGICRLMPEQAVPRWAVEGDWWSITRTTDELSVVAPMTSIPASVPMTGPWRAFQVEGPLEHDLVGVLAGLAAPLAAGGISIFALSTFDTDYLLVSDERLEDATSALRLAGHLVS